MLILNIVLFFRTQNIRKKTFRDFSLKVIFSLITQLIIFISSDFEINKKLKKGKFTHIRLLPGVWE